jgi:hypothetical protein
LVAYIVVLVRHGHTNIEFIIDVGETMEERIILFKQSEREGF